MKRKKQNRKIGSRMRSCRGFSVAEMILTLAVIVIVSLAATTIILNTTDSLNQARCEINAVREARNALEVFKYAKDDGEFALTYQQLSATEFGNYTVTFEAKYHREYTIGDEEVEIPTFTAIGMDPDGKVFLNIVYRKPLPASESEAHDEDE